jgi:hypothetical protein
MQGPLSFTDGGGRDGIARTPRLRQFVKAPGELVVGQKLLVMKEPQLIQRPSSATSR